MANKTMHAWRIHLGLFFAEILCLSAFVLELSRALSGNTLSWAYVAEWPILGTYAVYMWRKLLTDDASSSTSRPAPTNERDEQRLADWNEYLAAVHDDDPSDQRKL